jgi:hypothetical protein
MVRTAALVVALVGSASGFITPSPKLAAPLARSHVRASPTMVFGGFGRNGGLGGGGAGGRRFRGPFRNGNKNNNKGGVGNGGAGGSAGNGGKGNNGDVTAWMGGDDSGDGTKKAVGGLAGMLAVYEGWCETSPLLTKGVTSMIGFTLGDLLAQVRRGASEHMRERRRRVHLPRVAIMPMHRRAEFYSRVIVGRRRRASLAAAPLASRSRGLVPLASGTGIRSRFASSLPTPLAALNDSD